MAKKRKAKPFTLEGWNWVTKEVDLDEIAARLCEHGARVVLEVIGREAEASVGLWYCNGHYWAINCHLSGDSIGVEPDDELISIHKPLQELITEIRSIDQESFDALKTEVMSALAELERRMRPTEEDLERLRNEHNELAKRFPYMKPA